MPKLIIEEPLVGGRTLDTLRRQIQEEHKYKVKLLSRSIDPRPNVRRLIYEFLLLKPGDETIREETPPIELDEVSELTVDLPQVENQTLQADIPPAHTD